MDTRQVETAVVFDIGGEPWVVERPRGATEERRCLCSPGESAVAACPRHGIGSREGNRRARGESAA